MTDVIVWIDTRNPRYAAHALLAAAALIEADGAVPFVTYEEGAIRVEPGDREEAPDGVRADTGPLPAVP